MYLCMVANRAGKAEKVVKAPFYLFQAGKTGKCFLLFDKLFDATF